MVVVYSLLLFVFYAVACFMSGVCLVVCVYIFSDVAGLCFQLCLVNRCCLAFLVVAPHTTTTAFSVCCWLALSCCFYFCVWRYLAFIVVVFLVVCSRCVVFFVLF